MMDFLGGLFSAGMRFLGADMDRNTQENIAERNFTEQDLMNRQGLTLRARDATQAQAETGINRLAMMGMNAPSWSNVVGDSKFGEALGGAGQDIGRAVASLAPKDDRVDVLNNKLLEAKIANVNADTVRLQAIASRTATTLGQPGTGPGIPFPPSDPRGPVINLMQRARDPRTGEILWIPSEKAASPLQTLAASPINAAIAGGTVYDALRGDTRPFGTEGGGFVAPGAAGRAVDNYNWTYGVP